MAIEPNSRNATRWTIRIIPFFIFGAFGFAIYAVVAHQCGTFLSLTYFCLGPRTQGKSFFSLRALTRSSSLPVNYLYRQKHHHGTAIALIVLFFVTWFLSLAGYFRTFYRAQRNQGLVPLSERRKAVVDQRQALPKKEQRDLEGQHDWQPADLSPDSPGLERFYSKDIFVCEPDGRPRWCSLCWNWKPDRASHSSDLDRCVRKMDHLCPWVGGMVSETCMWLPGSFMRNIHDYDFGVLTDTCSFQLLHTLHLLLHLVPGGMHRYLGILPADADRRRQIARRTNHRHPRFGWPVLSVHGGNDLHIHETGL